MSEKYRASKSDREYLETQEALLIKCLIENGELPDGIPAFNAAAAAESLDRKRARRAQCMLAASPFSSFLQYFCAKRS